jgi:hypothetical protein
MGLDAYHDKMEEMHNAIDAVIPEGDAMHVYYSAYDESKATELPLNNLKKVAIRGKVIVIQEYDDFWDVTGNGESYNSEVLENPSYLELAVLANKMILVTGDQHHNFFEGVSATKRKNRNGVKIYRFAMGS